MINVDEYVRRAEAELRLTRTISRELCAAFCALPIASRYALADVMVFVGCEPVEMAPCVGNVSVETRTADRLTSARLMLLKMSVDTGTPLWSSQVLEHGLEAVLRAPGGAVGDVFRALCKILEEFAVPLNTETANFLKEVTVRCFSRYRESYDKEDFEWMAQRVCERGSSAVAYLALHALPEDLISMCRPAMLQALSLTPFADEAHQALEPDPLA